ATPGSSKPRGAWLRPASRRRASLRCPLLALLASKGSVAPRPRVAFPRPLLDAQRVVMVASRARRAPGPLASPALAWAADPCRGGRRARRGGVALHRRHGPAAGRARHSRSPQVPPVDHPRQVGVGLEVPTHTIEIFAIVTPLRRPRVGLDGGQLI